MHLTKKLALDIAERTVWTYLQVFVGLIIAGGLTSVSLSVAKTAAIAAIPAALAVIKGALAQLSGSPDSASTLPQS